MAYGVKDHGFWRPYTPDPIPEWASAATAIGGAVVFLRRDGDGVDLYEYLKSEPFGAGAIVATTVADASGVETVGTVFRDASMVFPFNQRLIEISGVDPAETKPQDLFGWLTFDPATLTFSGEAKPPAPPDMSRPDRCSKLGLKRAFDELGMWPTVRSAIGADPDTQEEWELAVTVRRDDPLVRKVQAGLGITDDQVTKLLGRAVALAG